MVHKYRWRYVDGEDGECCDECGIQKFMINFREGGGGAWNNREKYGGYVGKEESPWQHNAIKIMEDILPALDKRCIIK